MFLPLSTGCSDSWQPMLNRREMLRLGGSGILGYTLPGLMAKNATASNGRERRRARARSCILLFMTGGPSQLETFDPKPNSLFPAISTTVPGTQICEQLPDVAKLAHHFALVRTVWHTIVPHNDAHRYVLTGFSKGETNARPDDRPGIIALAAKYLRRPQGMPTSVMLPWIAGDNAGVVSGGMGGGTLGKQFDPLVVDADPTSLDRPIRQGPQGPGMKELLVPPQPTATSFREPQFALPPGVTAERFEGRRRLLEEIDGRQQQRLVSIPADDMRLLYREAYDLLGSSSIKEALDLDQESGKLRERYGLNAFGQSCLAARRFIEKGTRFVQVNAARGVVQDSYGWDTHRLGRDTLKDHLLPKLNAGLSALLTDLCERGILAETLVVVMGDFGRSPGFGPDGGRDHHPHCYSILLAGGGIHGGLVHGKSDKRGGLPVEDPVEARNVLMTILTLLGIPAGVADGLPAPLFQDAAPVDRLYT
jgi:hypothetical protein